MNIGCPWNAIGVNLERRTQGGPSDSRSWTFNRALDGVGFGFQHTPTLNALYDTGHVEVLRAVLAILAPADDAAELVRCVRLAAGPTALHARTSGLTDRGA
jgi:hypothetical protein